MAGEREISIPYLDLIKISIACKHCAGEITANVAESRQIRLRSEREQYICPLCRMEFDGRVAAALVHLGEWVRLIRESEHAVMFRIKDPDD